MVSDVSRRRRAEAWGTPTATRTRPLRRRRVRWRGETLGAPGATRSVVQQGRRSPCVHGTPHARSRRTPRDDTTRPALLLVAVRSTQRPHTTTLHRPDDPVPKVREANGGHDAGTKEDRMLQPPPVARQPAIHDHDDEDHDQPVDDPPSDASHTRSLATSGPVRLGRSHPCGTSGDFTHVVPAGFTIRNSAPQSGRFPSAFKATDGAPTSCVVRAAVSMTRAVAWSLDVRVETLTTRGARRRASAARAAKSWVSSWRVMRLLLRPRLQRSSTTAPTASPKPQPSRRGGVRPRARNMVQTCRRWSCVWLPDREAAETLVPERRRKKFLPRVGPDLGAPHGPQHGQSPLLRAPPDAVECRSLGSIL